MYRLSVSLESGIDFVAGDPETSTTLGATFGINHHILYKISSTFVICCL